MFGSCISLNALKGKNTAAQYIETLKNYLLTEILAAAGSVTFQQDNTTIHKTLAVHAFFSKTTLLMYWNSLLKARNYHQSKIFGMQ